MRKSKTKRPAAATRKAKGKSATAAKTTGKAGPVDKVLAAFGSREGSNQAAALTRLARDLGKPVDVGEVAAAVYGPGGDHRSALAMVLKGIEGKIKNGKTGFKLTKSGERGAATLTLSASR